MQTCFADERRTRAARVKNERASHLRRSRSTTLADRGVSRRRRCPAPNRRIGRTCRDGGPLGHAAGVGGCLRPMRARGARRRRGVVPESESSPTTSVAPIGERHVGSNTTGPTRGSPTLSRAVCTGLQAPHQPRRYSLSGADRCADITSRCSEAASISARTTGPLPSFSRPRSLDASRPRLPGNTSSTPPPGPSVDLAEGSTLPLEDKRAHADAETSILSVNGAASEIEPERNIVLAHLMTGENS